MQVQNLKDLNPVLTNENSVSDFKIEKNEETTIAQRALALGSRFTTGVFNTGKHSLQGVAIWTGVLGFYTKSKAIDTLYRMVFDPESFELRDEFFLSLKGKQLKQTLENNKPFHMKQAEARGYQPSPDFDSGKIATSSCPAEEYRHQLYLLTGQKHSWKTDVFGIAVLPAVTEELLFRELMQTTLLKHLVKKIVKKIAPGHEDKVDSKIYTAVRILLTSAAFSLFHESNRGILSDEYVDMQRFQTFFMGIGFGILKETLGLPSAMGAHFLNNVTASAPSFMSRC